MESWYLCIKLYKTVIEVDESCFYKKKAFQYVSRSEVLSRSLDDGVKLFVDSQPVNFIYVGRFVDIILVCATSADVVNKFKDLIVASNNDFYFTSENPINGCL